MSYRVDLIFVSLCILCNDFVLVSFNCVVIIDKVIKENGFSKERSKDRAGSPGTWPPTFGSGDREYFNIYSLDLKHKLTYL